MTIKTQEQMYWEAHRKVAETNQVFMDMVTHPTHPITKTELRALIQRRPELWSRFSHWLDSDHLKD